LNATVAQKSPARIGPTVTSGVLACTAMVGFGFASTPAASDGAGATPVRNHTRIKTAKSLIAQP
jgi:hypothetical protein